MYTDPDITIPSAVALRQKGHILFMGFPMYSHHCKSGHLSLYPHHWVYLKNRNHPFDRSAGLYQAGVSVYDFILMDSVQSFTAKKLRTII